MWHLICHCRYPFTSYCGNMCTKLGRCYIYPPSAHMFDGNFLAPSGTFCSLTSFSLVEEHHIITSVREAVADTDWLMSDIYWGLSVLQCSSEPSLYRSHWFSPLFSCPEWFSTLILSALAKLGLNDSSHRWVTTFCRIALISPEGMMQGVE